MQTLKVMSIIGLIIFILSIICIIAWGGTRDNDAALGWGLIGCIYGIAFSIVGIVQSNKIKIKGKR